MTSFHFQIHDIFAFEIRNIVSLKDTLKWKMKVSRLSAKRKWPPLKSPGSDPSHFPTWILLQTVRSCVTLITAKHLTMKLTNYNHHEGGGNKRSIDMSFLLLLLWSVAVKADFKVLWNDRFWAVLDYIFIGYVEPGNDLRGNAFRFKPFISCL